MENCTKFDSGKVSGDEGQPDYAECVEGDVDVLCLVKILWDFSSKKCIVGAEKKEEEVVAQ